MLKKVIKNNTKENILYNNILLLSRNKLFYTKFGLADTFQNRIHLIFLHISFLFVKIKQNKQNQLFKIFNQKMFDTNSEENENKTPARMARLAWPKSKYGVVLAVIIIIIINLIFYRDTIFSFLK